MTDDDNLPDAEKVGRLRALNATLAEQNDELRRRLGPTLEPKVSAGPWVRQADIPALFAEGRGPEVYAAAQSGRILPTLAAPEPPPPDAVPGLIARGQDVFEMTSPPTPKKER